MRKFYRIILLLFVFFLPDSSFVFAFHADTHEKINGYIVDNSLDGFSLGFYLKNYLGFSEGKKEMFESQKGECKREETHTVREWIVKGGTWEDNPPPNIISWSPHPGGILCPDIIRAFNHYYDPLSGKGYSNIPPLTGNSAIEWFMEKDSQEEPGNWVWNNLGRYSWQDVNDYFFRALTSDDEAEREDAFADTFRGLGQLMHSVFSDR